MSDDYKDHVHVYGQPQHEEVARRARRSELAERVLLKLLESWDPEGDIFAHVLVHVAFAFADHFLDIEAGAPVTTQPRGEVSR